MDQYELIRTAHRVYGKNVGNHALSLFQFELKLWIEYHALTTIVKYQFICYEL